MYEKAIKKYLLWLKDNPTWNFISNAEHQKDLEFLASVVFDVDFAIKIADEIGMPDEATMWRTEQADAVSMLKQWFLSDPEKLHQFRFTDAPNKYYGNGREGDSPIAVMNAIICDGLPEEDYIRLINYYRSGVDPLIGVGGFSGYKYPQAAMAVYGMIKRGYKAEARQYINLAVRDTVRVGDFSETIIEAPELEGVKPSLFSAAGLIDFTWMMNGCMAYTGTPTPLDLDDGQAQAKTPYENLALNKPVEVSSNENNSSNAARNATDGSLATRWSSQYSDPQWIYVDLGEVKSINRVRLQWEAAYGKDYTVDVSKDAVDWTTVRAVTGGYENYIRGENDRCDDLSFQSTEARYVRMRGTKRAIDAGFSLWEFEVYSDPNIALGTTAMASSGVSSAAAVTDGHLKTQWNSDKSDTQWIYTDLGETRYIDRVRLAWNEAYGKSYSIQVSDDAAKWTDVYSTTDGVGGVDNIAFEPITARYVRMNGAEAGTAFGYSLKEFAVYDAFNQGIPELPAVVVYDPITVKTVKNVIPRLPQKIMVTVPIQGENKKVPVDVVWNEMTAEDFITVGDKIVKGRIVLNNQEIEAAVHIIDTPEIVSESGAYDVEQYKTAKLQVKSGSETLSGVVWSIKDPGCDAAGGVGSNGILQTAKAGAVTVAAQLPELGITVEGKFTILPRNVVSFAYGGTAAASSHADEAQDPAKAIDEDTATMLRFTSRNSEWFQVELKNAVVPTGIMTRWYDGNQPKTYDVYFSMSGADGEWEKVKSVTSPDTGRNDYTDIQAFEEPKQTKFIRIAATGESKNGEAGIFEFKVFADPEITRPVRGIALTSAQAGAKLQMNASVTPIDATDDRVEWSVTDENGSETALADISSTGILTFFGKGKVKVTAASASNPEITTSQAIEAGGQSAVNVALNKKATANKYITGTGVGPDFAFDGDIKTCFKTGQIKGGDTPPFNLAVDLRGQFRISFAELDLGATNRADFVIQYSNDNSTWQDIPGTAITDNNNNFHTFTFDPVDAKFLRIKVSKTYSEWGFEVNEFKAYGVSVSELTPPNDLAIDTIVGIPPALPATVECTNGAGGTVAENVAWKTIDPSKYAVAGSFRADGNLADGIPVYAIVYVKPALYFDLNGEEGTIPARIIETVGQPVGELPAPESENREFLGWNTRADGEGEVYKADTEYTSHGNTTLYAVWKWKIPVQPSVEQFSDTESVTLTVSPVTAGEYAVVAEGEILQDSDWRASNKFTGLPPVTGYDVYTRHRKTLGTEASEISPKRSITTSKLVQEAPTVEYTKQGDWETEGITITITSPMAGASYSLEPDFSVTTPSPIYFPAGVESAEIYVRLDETDTQYPSETVMLELDFSKQVQDAPSITWETASDESSITLTVSASGGQTGGYEYRLDDETAYTDLPADGVITGLTPGKLINLFVRSEGDAEYNSSPDAAAIIVLPKYKNSATVAMTEANFSVTDTSIAMIAAPEATSGSAIEYSFDGGEYAPLDIVNLPSFTGLTPDSSYTISARAAEDAVREAGPATTVILSTTKSTQPGNDDDDDRDDDNSGTKTPDVNGSTITPKTAVSNGTTTARLSAASVRKALANAQHAAKGTGKAPEMTVEVASGSNTDTVAVTIPANAFKEIGKSPETLLTIKAGDVHLTFSDEALSAIGRNAGGDIVATAGRTDESKLTDEQRRAVQGRPVYSLSVTSGDTKHTDFEGNVRVSLPYTLKPGEDPNAIVIYYVDGEGNLRTVENSVYDPETGRVTFTAVHFSEYMIGYNPVEFRDVPDSHWGRKAIGFAAARGLVQGTGSGLYSPDRGVTRAEFVQMVQNVLKFPEGTDAAGYSDVAADQWYYKAVMSLKSAGLLEGLRLKGDSFKPAEAVTREEMAVILANAAAYKKADASSGKIDLSGRYRDYQSMEKDYLDEIETVAELGLMRGTADDMFSPESTVTRAQAAQVQMNLLELLYKN